MSSKKTKPPEDDQPEERPAKLGQPTVAVGLWKEFADEVGGILALAALLRVHRRTLHRWVTGETEPTYLEQLGINAKARDRGAPVPYPRVR